MQEKAEYKEDLKRNGLKITKSRKAILDILRESEQPFSAEQIYLKLKGKQIAINLSTVYRTLGTLEEKGLVTKLNIMGDDKMFFEYNKTGHRHYLVCVDCKKIVTIHKCPLITFEKTLEMETNFKIEGHELLLYGHCLECQNNLVTK